jgi:tripartite-type tricarboxylate transporter receptor subunit TctC
MIRKALFCLSTLVCLPLAVAQGFPDKPITLVQGFAAGGNADTIARIMAQGLSRELGQAVVVEAKTGAGGNVASAAVARARPDGYTLILLTGGHAVSAAMYKSQSFDPVEDFDWLSMVTRFPFVLATASDSPYKTVADVVRAAKSQPGTVSYSSVGVGSTQHLSGELFQSLAGVQMNHIPYRGGAAPLQDVLTRRVDLMFDSVTVTKAQIDTGKLRALGVTSVEPSPFLPGVTPLRETVKDFDVNSWTALAAPKGLPPAVAQKIHAATLKVLADPAVIKQLEGTGGLASPSASGQEMKQYAQTQIVKWRKVVQEANIPQQ